MINTHKLKYFDQHSLDCFNNPQPGDVWHERFCIVLIIVAVFEDFVIAAKTYLENNERYVSEKIENLKVYTREELLDQLSYCDCFPRIDTDKISVSKPWLKKLFDNYGLSFDNQINEEILSKINKKKEEIKFKNIPEYNCLMNPSPGDLWHLGGNEYLCIIDRYLKKYLIISHHTNLLSIGNVVFKDIKLIDYDQFRLYVLNETVEKGFKASVEPLILKEEVKLFKETQ